MQGIAVRLQAFCLAFHFINSSGPFGRANSVQPEIEYKRTAQGMSRNAVAERKLLLDGKFVHGQIR